jgi:hypothetical protein
MYDGSTTYVVSLDSGRAARDFYIGRYFYEALTILASEAVDIAVGGVYQVVGSMSGSTIRGYRDIGYTTVPRLRVSATDTIIASGAYGYSKRGDVTGSGVHEGYALLRASLSPLPPAQAILEVDVVGSGRSGDPFRPSLPGNLVEITSLTGLPDFLYLEAKRYELLKNKGFTDEEMQLLLGYIPQHQVDLDSVTWGAFELHPREVATVIITITGDNPYSSGAIERQKAKARRVFTPPKDYSETVALYRQLKGEYPDWLAGKDNLAYQVLGLEELDLMQNVDFYYGELLEHKTHYQQLKQIPDWEIRGRLEELVDRLSKVTILVEERDKHIAKAREVLRVGW